MDLAVPPCRCGVSPLGFAVFRRPGQGSGRFSLTSASSAMNFRCRLELPATAAARLSAATALMRSLPLQHMRSGPVQCRFRGTKPLQGLVTLLRYSRIGLAGAFEPAALGGSPFAGSILIGGGQHLHAARALLPFV